MKKILIVEDRPKRQEQYIPGGKSGMQRLMKMEGVTSLCGGEECLTHLKRLESSTTDLEKYDLLIYHRSALDKFLVSNEVNEFCKKNKTPLIHFTGGENSTTYLNDDFEYLLLSSRIFYSYRLFDFIKNFQLNEDIPLIRFVGGRNWQLPYLFELRNMFWQHDINQFNDIYLEDNLGNSLAEKINTDYFGNIVESLNLPENFTADILTNEIKKLTILL